MKKTIVAACFLALMFAAIFIWRYQITPKAAPQQIMINDVNARGDKTLNASPAVPLVEVPRRSRKHQLREVDRRFLVSQGLQNPIDALVQDLMSHNELIPCKGAVGGNPGFYSAEKIAVLGRDRVTADYEDGHVAGTIELSFVVSNAKITWTVIGSDCGN